MLVLSRKLNEKIQLGDNITVTVLRVQGNTIRLGIDAPRDVRILRGELEPMDSHRKTKDQLFTVISDNGSADAGEKAVEGDNDVAEPQGEGDADRAPAGRRAVGPGRSELSPSRLGLGKAESGRGKARSGRPLASFVSAAPKPTAVLHPSL